MHKPTDFLKINKELLSFLYFFPYELFSQGLNQLDNFTTFYQRNVIKLINAEILCFRSIGICLNMIF